MKFLLKETYTFITAILAAVVFEINKDYFMALAYEIGESVYLFFSSPEVIRFQESLAAIPSFGWFLLVFQVAYTYLFFVIEEKVKLGNASAIKWAKRFRLSVVNPESDDYALK